MTMQVALVMLLKCTPHGTEEHLLLDDWKIWVVMNVQERGLKENVQISMTQVKNTFKKCFLT